MSMLSKFAVTAALAATTVGLAAGTAHAEPLSVDIAPRVNFTANVEGNSAVITTDAGTLAVEGGQFRIKAASGQTLAGLPLEYRVDDKVFPIDAKIDGNKATITPSQDPARAVLKPVAGEKTAEEREQKAWNRMKDNIGLGVTAGAIIGGVVGGGLGCIVGGGVALPTAVLTAIFGPLAGCVAGALVMAPVGALAGTIFVAAPVAIASVIQYFTVVNQPFVPAK